MAVYTKLSRIDIETLLAPLTSRPLLDWRGVSAGVENTTYFLTLGEASAMPDCAPRELVLTIAEHHPREGVIHISQWQRALAAAGLPVPGPLADAGGRCVHAVQGKPALVAPRCSGRHPHRPGTAHCAAIGASLAAMHQVALGSDTAFPSSRSLDWLAATASEVSAHIANDPRSEDTGAQLSQELAWLAAARPALSQLPHGIIHGDLFRDNALFEGDQLTAIIDFFMAGTGPLLLDLAIAINDWCVADSQPDAALTGAMLQAYAAVRQPTPAEQAWWPAALRLAALRFWVSRLADQMHAEQGRPRQGKDPASMLALLRLRRASPQPWPQSIVTDRSRI
ncbi:MAG: phosphotransferase [Spongiibacteraceae bacterium]|jgi:homoserine kinase type II|nr:phosphotransferase [Spongiibacteraceae bacterium]